MPLTPKLSPAEVSAQIDALYREESGRILASLIRLLGDFDRAEDAMHDAFGAALERWPDEGVPANPRSWLISTGRFKAIDAMRRQARLNVSEDKVADALHGEAAAEADGGELQDDRLKLIFACCHPAVPADARAALTLREICGLTTGRRPYRDGSPKRSTPAQSERARIGVSEVIF